MLNIEIKIFWWYNVYGTVIPFSVSLDLGSKRINSNEKERIIERGMHMIDKIISIVNKIFIYLISKLTITIKTPIIDFSFAPMVSMPKGNYIISRWIKPSAYYI